MVKIIRCEAKNKVVRKRYEPTPIWWKGMTKEQQIAYIAKLDHLDRRALKTRADYKIKGN
jgi:hypothetical protein